jgi:ribosomal protein S18 acetylase RimI-like enzyme
MSLNMAEHREFVVRNTTAADIDLAIEWAASEGWNPGLHDAACFRHADPGGFFVGELNGEVVASLSAIAYDSHFGFIGLYIVKPAFRGQGLGLRIWQHGIDYLGRRNIGLDGVIAQQSNYRKSGFQLAYRNIRFEGIVQGATHAGIVNAAELPFGSVLAYDRRCFPAARDAFLSAWLGQPDCVALAALRDERIAGYGVLRRCRAGGKIGPLFADSEPIANELLDALATYLAGEVIVLDVPEPNDAAIRLAERRGMKSAFETARMYTQAPPTLELERVFGVTTFELG